VPTRDPPQSLSPEEQAALLERERQARREAETERARMENLIMEAPAFIALFRGPQHVYALSNRRNTEALGHRIVLGKPMGELLPGAVTQGFVALLDQVYSTGQPFSAEQMPVQVSRPDGTQSEHFVNFIYQPTRDAQGHVDGVASFGFEVTALVRARQQAEALAAELKRGEERYRAFVSKSTEGIYRVDVSPPIPTTLPEAAQIDRMFRDAHIAECNDAMARMYGLPGATELVGTRLDTLLVREDPRNTEYLQAFLQNGYRIEDAESREVAHDGTPKVFLNNLVGIVRDGLLLGAWGTQRDVSEQRHAEEELKRAESHSRFLSEASAVLASDLDYEATLRNVARLAVPSLADWCLVDLLQPDGSFKRVEAVCTNPEDDALAQQIRRTVVTRDGNPRYPVIQAIHQGRAVLLEELSPQQIQEVALSEHHAKVMAATRIRSMISAPMVVRGRTLGVLTFFMSHSGRRYTAAELSVLEELARRAALSVENARLYKEAQDAVRLRDEFLSIASHELKTPLTPLSLKLQMLMRETRRQPDSPFRHSVEDYIAVGSRQVKKLSELVSDLLDVSRIVGGRLRLELEDVELRALVREVVARYEPEAVRVGSTLVLNEAPEPVSGRWDRLRLEQVITNLVDNAIKYGAGRPILLTLEADAERAVLRVKDEGIGIAPEHLKRIFERFERAVSERHYGGLGLGLYITRTIVEAMRGSIQVESTLGQGALFTVLLPRRPPEPTPGLAAV
jgi:PAS domain S-box-containing protein